MRKKILLLGLLTLVPAAVQLHASVSKTQAGMVWKKSAFSPVSQITGVPTFYLGATTTAVGSENFSLASSSLTAGSGAGVRIDPLAPANTANDAIILNKVAANSPFNNQVISNLDLLNSIYPVVTIDGDTNAYLVIKPDDGKIVLKNDVAINDAAGSGNPTKEIKAVTASTDTIFAAVSANGADWQDLAGANRGIAVLKAASDSSKLNVYDATDFGTAPGAANKATKASVVAADKVVAFSAAAVNNAELTADVNMFFDQTLERLYVGLKGAKRTTDGTEGGVLGVFMGRVDPAGSKSLVLQPVVNNVAPALFNTNDNKGIVGFYADGTGGGNGPFAATIDQINTMHTSTNKDYLVVNSNVVGQAGAPGLTGVFALPLLGKKDAKNAVAIDQDKIGTISQVDPVTRAPTFNDSPTVFAQMPIATDLAVTVGGGTPFGDPTKITEIFVEGDTVYMCAADTGANVKANTNSGIFASTAIFAQDGSIRAWTPIQRVMGSIERVWGGGLDTQMQPGDFYMLTSQDLTVTDTNTVKITQWGSTNSVTAQSAIINNLSSLLAELFPLEDGGLVGLYSFDEKTPGFLADSFAMMVAVGKTKVALIQMATLDGTGNFALTPNFVVGANVFVFDETTVLGDIMPLTGAEVSRMTAADSGWLFVAGCNGVAVLSLANGNGWASDVGLSALVGTTNPGDFPGGGTTFTFKKLVEDNPGEFMNVRKLVASDGRMYVETLNGIFFFDMDDAGKFDGVPSTLLGELEVAGLGDSLIADLVVLSKNASGGDPDNNNFGVIATNNGLFASTLSINSANTIPVTGTSGLELQLQLVGDFRSQAPVTGNVYMLATDFANNNDKLYRFDANSNALTLADLVKTVTTGTTGLTEEFNASRQSFMTDGTFVYNTLPKNYGSTDYLTLTNIDGSGSTDVTPLLGLDLSQNTYISGVLREGSSGAIMVPGDWGVRVNE